MLYFILLIVSHYDYLKDVLKFEVSNYSFFQNRSFSC